jgi:hypothetical protein
LIDFKAAIGMGPMSDTRIVGIFVIAAVVANGGVCYTITAYFLGFMIEQFMAEKSVARTAGRLGGGCARRWAF